VSGRSDLAIAANNIFETGQLRRTNWSTGMHAAGGDADFSAHSEFTTIGKLG
jgi:hypothetical protein